MRVLLFLVAVSGCYAPSIIEGAPCGAGDVCPGDLVCDPSTVRCVREPTPHADAPTDVSSDGAIDGPVIADAPPGVTDFHDDFARANSTAIGNGWIEKTPATFSILNNEVVRIDSGAISYRDNLVYRPASDDLRDLEISIEFRVLSLPPRYPQIFVRARRATITAMDSYDGYLLYVNGSVNDQVVLGRQLGGVFVGTLAQIALSPALAAGQVYRLTLRAVGASPVSLTAKVELRSAGSYTVIGSTTFSDVAPERIETAGTYGFSGDELPRYVFDEFVRRAL